MYEQARLNSSSQLNAKVVRFLAFACAGLVGAAVTGVVHELGHFIPAYLFNWAPFISFADGGRVDMRALPSSIPPWMDFLTLVGGPVATFLSAGLFIWLSRKYPASISLFVLALWNSVYRFNVLIDGRGADEAKMSSLIAFSYSIQAVSVIVSTLLAWALISRQDFIPKRLWVIPLAFLGFAICYRSSLNFMSKIFG